MKDNYLKFEYYCVNKHQNDYKEIVYHWSNIPDKVLIDSGYFDGENELREKRKKCKNGILKEYGIDAPIHNINLYKRAFIHRSYVRRPNYENKTNNIADI